MGEQEIPLSVFTAVPKFQSVSIKTTDVIIFHKQYICIVR